MIGPPERRLIAKPKMGSTVLIFCTDTKISLHALSILHVADPESVALVAGGCVIESTATATNVYTEQGQFPLTAELVTSLPLTSAY